MITADARHDRFSLLTDFIYFNLGGTAAQFKSINSPGFLPVPVSGSARASEGMNLNAEYWTLAGGYTLASGEWGNVDLIAGFRFIEINSRIDYSLGLTLIGPGGRGGTFGGVGSVSSSGSVWNGIGGFRGSIRIGDTGFFVPGTISTRVPAARI